MFTKDNNIQIAYPMIQKSAIHEKKFIELCRCFRFCPYICAMSDCQFS